MSFTAQLHTTTTAWPTPDAVAVAINAQAGLDAQVRRQHDDLVITCRQQQRASSAALRPFDQTTYDLQRVQLRSQISERECDAAPRFARTVVLTTPGDDAAAALCQVVIADALWWLLGGFLADLTTGTLWGRSAWRQDHSLREHAATLLARSEAAVSALPPPATPGRGAHPPAGGITVYTLPYCRHCRTLTAYLTERGIAYQEVNVAQTPGAAAQMLGLNNGQRAAPTITIGGQVLVGPEPDELDSALQAAGLLPSTARPAASPAPLPGWIAPCTLPGC